MTTNTIELPHDVAKSAQQAGFLSGRTLASIVRELARDRAARMLQQAMQRLDDRAASADELTPGELQRAIDATPGH